MAGAPPARCWLASGLSCRSRSAIDMLPCAPAPHPALAAWAAGGGGATGWLAGVPTGDCVAGFDVAL